MKSFFPNKRFLCAGALAMGILGDTVGQAQPAVEAWVQRYDGPIESNDQAQKAVVDSSGDVIVAGNSDAGASRSDWLIIKYSSAGGPANWAKRYNGPANGDDFVKAVAVDGSGNVVVAGYSFDRFGVNSDYVTIKYSGAGAPLWTNRYNGPGNAFDQATAVAVDGGGSVFVTGYSRSSSGAGSEDYATVAYSSAGVPLWTNRYNGSGNGGDYGTAVKVDGSSNVVVTGYSTGSGSGNDYATIKYSGAGVPLWTNRYNGPANSEDGATAVAVDGSGNAFVTGYSTGSGSGNDYATIKYSGAGVPLWTNRYNGPANSEDAATAVAVVDGGGNVVVTGYSTGSGSGNDYATIKYSGAGVPLWTNHYNGPANGDDIAMAVTVDGSSNVAVTGYSTGSGSGNDYATIKYSGAGVPLWTNRYNGPANAVDQANAVAADGSGNVFVAGYSARFPGSYNYATIKYSGTGVPLWTNLYHAPGNGFDFPTAVAVDGSGNVVVTGYSQGNGSGNDYATIKYSSTGVPLWLNRYNGPGNSDDHASALAVDSGGNVYVTGRSIGSGSGYDYATIKYSSAGVPLWTSRYLGPGNDHDYAYALAVDGGSNVVVTGTTATTNYEYATIKYSTAGVPLWTNLYSGPGNRIGSAQAVAVDGSGNVFVTGASYGGGTAFDYATIKYSSAGVPLWTNRYNGPGNDTDGATALAVDGTSNVVVTGKSYGSGGVNPDYATIKYSSAGVPLWLNRYNGPGNSDDIALAVAVDGSDNVFVTGYSWSGSNNYSSDYATLAYSSAGVPLWANRYDGPANNDDQAWAVAVDHRGTVVVTGYSKRGDPFAEDIEDFGTIAYSTAGVPLWTNYYNGPGNGSDGAIAVAVDGGGNAFVTGYSTGSGSGYDYATIKYSSAGAPLLAISRTTTNTVAVSWPSPSAGFSLQTTTNLGQSNSWTSVDATPVVINSQNIVTNKLTNGSHFYRLFK